MKEGSGRANFRLKLQRVVANAWMGVRRRTVTECLEHGEAEFLLGLRDVVEAHGGVGELAKVAKLNRESLYRLLSKRGNPRLSSLSSILGALGIELQFTPKEQTA